MDGSLVLPLGTGHSRCDRKRSRCVFRDDLGEETKADIAQLFHEYLTEGGDNIAAAYQASARLAI